MLARFTGKFSGPNMQTKNLPADRQEARAANGQVYQGYFPLTWQIVACSIYQDKLVDLRTCHPSTSLYA